jgi:hypothetical protein
MMQVYTMKTAGVGLDWAKHVMANPDQYNDDQKARALVVVRYWQKLRAKQKAKQAEQQSSSLDYHFADKD